MNIRYFFIIFSFYILLLTSFSKPIINWYKHDLPPFYISSGTYENRGSVDSAIKIIQKNNIFLNKIVNLVFGDFSVNVLDCFVQKLRKVGIFKRFTGCFRSETTAYHFHFAEYHFRVLNKI